MTDKDTTRQTQQAHVKAGLDIRDTEYLTVNTDRSQPTVVEYGGRKYPID